MSQVADGEMAEALAMAVGYAAVVAAVVALLVGAVAVAQAVEDALRPPTILALELLPMSRSDPSAV